jgi:hypothetical protein
VNTEQRVFLQQLGDQVLGCKSRPSVPLPAAILLATLLAQIGCMRSETPEEKLRTNNECNVAGDRFWAEYRQREFGLPLSFRTNENAKLSHRNHFNRELGECLVKIDLYEYGDDQEEVYIAAEGKFFASHTGVTASDGPPGLWSVWKNGKAIDVTLANDLPPAEKLNREATVQWFDSLMKK